MRWFVHAALKSCQEKKRASLSLYLDIKALAHSDSSCLFYISFYSNLSSTWRVYKGSCLVVLTTLYKKRIAKNKYEIKYAKRSHYKREPTKKTMLLGCITLRGVTHEFPQRDGGVGASAELEFDNCGDLERLVHLHGFLCVCSFCFFDLGAGSSTLVL